MRTVRMMMFLVAFLGLGMAFTSCGNNASADGDGTEQTGKEYTSAYICPMYCSGSGSEEPGKCPVCGMDYVKNEKTTDEGHSHDGHDHSDHDGHDHGEHDGHDHGDHDGHNH